MLLVALLFVGAPKTAIAAATPLYVAAGAISTGTGAITPALPAGIRSGDILLLFIKTSNQTITISNANGGTWTQVTNSPQGTGTGANTTSARLTVFWSRYNGTQGNPTASDSGDDQLARIVAIRGALASGDPTDVTAGSADSTADTSGTLPGATTTGDNELIISGIATALPDATGTANFSGWANSDLADVNELTDNTTTSGVGGGLGIVYGTKNSTGTYGNTTVTLAASSVKASLSIALKPATTAPAPWFVAAGTVTSGASTIAPALPAGILPGDILVLPLKTSNQTITISNANGGTWTQVTNSPQGTGTGANTTSARLTVFWSRYNGTQGNPTASDSGDDQLGRMIAIRGATTTEDPTDTTSGTTDAVANTSASISGSTTTIDGDYVLSMIATALPDAAGTANFSAETNSDLSGVTELTDNTVTAGAGGGLASIGGTMDTAGTYGSMSVTLAASSVKAMMTFALKPPGASAGSGSPTRVMRLFQGFLVHLRSGKIVLYQQ